jgi:hypothetical protein
MMVSSRTHSSKRNEDIPYAAKLQAKIDGVRSVDVSMQPHPSIGEGLGDVPSLAMHNNRKSRKAGK